MTATLLPNAKQQFLDSNGRPLAGGSVYFYIPNTSTFKNTWQDEGKTILNTNPVVLDSSGQAIIYGDGQYRQVVYDVHSNLIWDKLTDSYALNSEFQTFVSNIEGSSGSSIFGFIQSGVGAVERSGQSKLRDEINIRDFGALCDGTTDDTNALIAADAQAIARGKTLVIDGTPLIRQALTFSGKSNWRFEGASGTLSSDVPTSHLIKHSSVAGDLLTFTAGGICLDGLAIVGQNGNTGNGLTLIGNSPQILRPFITGMGQDGIRIGSDAGPSNVNSFYITNPRCISNVRDGININDKPAGTPDANSGSIINPITTSNGRHGIYGGNAYLGVTIICPTSEANTGWGIYLDTKFQQNIIIGGDIEANTAGNLFQATAFANTIINTTVQGKTIYNRAQLSSYIPTITGSTTAGTCTYSAQEGEFEVSGASVHFSVHIAYSGHTGSGQPYISLPQTPYISAPNMVFSPVIVVCAGLTLAAGAQVVGLIQRDGNRIQLYTDNAGVLAALNLPASGEFYIRGTYPLNTPNYFAV